MQKIKMQSGLVFDLMHFSTRDGPGIRTTVFLKGCPLHCAWCHNPESQSPQPEVILRPNLCIACGECISVCPEDAISQVNGVMAYDRSRCRACGACVEICTPGAREMAGKVMTTGQVLVEIEKDRPFYDESGGGVTFSGGEPLLQFDFLADLLHTCHLNGLNTVLDTSGFTPWNQLEAILPDVDLFLYDIKAMDDATHQKWTGVSNRLILENLNRLAEAGGRIIIRVPLIPGVNDTPDQMEALGRMAASLPGLIGIELLPYHKIGLEKYKRLQLPYLLAELEPPGQASLESVAKTIRQFQVECNYSI
jgi:pyruvate formate lyase activating enzyme